MGHVRVGRLPKRFGWQHVIAALGSSDSTTQEVVQTAASAARRALSQAKYQESLAFCYWLFVTLADASRRQSFAAELRRIGIAAPEGESGVSLIAAISDFAKSQVRAPGASTALDEIALGTFQSVVTNTVTQESQTLFGCTVETVQAALRRLSTKAKVAGLGRRFFSEYMYRALSHALERELANSLISQAVLQNSQDISHFHGRLRSYCWDVSKIVQEYSGGWYSKRAWEARLTLDDARRFTAYAVDKLLSELASEESTP
jgi:hypothetical protein